MAGMTVKQMNRAAFYAALDQYKQALATGTSEEIVRASLRIHAAKGNVPKSLWPLVTQAFRETKRADDAPPLKGQQ